MIDISRNCPLCLGPITYFGRNSLPTKYPDKPIEVKETECPRCGPFRYTEEALTEFNQLRDLGPDKVLPFAAVARERKDLRLLPPVFVTDRYERVDALPELLTLTAARNALPSSVEATFDRALLVLARRGPSPGSVVAVDPTADAPLLAAFDERGCLYLLEELEGQRLIEKRANNSFRLTGAGWRRVEEITQKRKSPPEETYVVPSPVRRSSTLHPPVPLAGGPLEPTFADAAYQQVVADLARAGQQMERTPATYERLDEEGLRDQFLLVLQTLYTASATGETYNKSGKTDILLRHEGKNVFIAECKFWKGEVALLEAVGQLLGYLTWRDSKAAILLFVENKNISAVLAQIEPVLRKHPRFVRTEGRPGEGEFRAAFHLEGDTGTHVKVALLAFHFPS